MKNTALKTSKISTNGIPKTLIKLLDKPLIDLLIQNCLDVGIQDIVIVTGYREDLIINHFKDLNSNLRIEFVYNIDWEFPNGLSVLAAKETIPKGEEFLVSMSDHFYLTIVSIKLAMLYFVFRI